MSGVLIVDPHAAGIETIRRVEAVIAGLTPAPTATQVRIVWFVIEMMAPSIFGAFWNTDRARIREKIGWMRDDADAGVMSVRHRQGKTVGIAMAAAVALIALPNADIGLYSNSEHVSSLTLRTAYSILYKHPSTAFLPMRLTLRALSIVHSPTDTRTVRVWMGPVDSECLGGDRYILADRGAAAPSWNPADVLFPRGATHFPLLREIALAPPERGFVADMPDPHAWMFSRRADGDD